MKLCIKNGGLQLLTPQLPSPSHNHQLQRTQDKCLIPTRPKSQKKKKEKFIILQCSICVYIYIDIQMVYNLNLNMPQPWQKRRLCRTHGRSVPCSCSHWKMLPHTWAFLPKNNSWKEIWSTLLKTKMVYWAYQEWFVPNLPPPISQQQEKYVDLNVPRSCFTNL